MSPARGGGSARVLSVGVAIAISSVVGYLLLAVVGRALTPAEFGLFVSFWGVLFGLAGSLSTIEQEAARQAAEPGTSARAPIRRVAATAGVIAATAAALTLLPPVALRFYGDADSRLGVLVLVAVLGFAVQFTVRGILVGSGQVRRYSVLVILEAVSRLVVLLVLWATVGLTLGTAAAAVVVGSYAWLVYARQLRRPASGPVTDPGRGTTTGTDDGRASWSASAARAGSLMLAAGLTASMITGYPTMVTAFSGGELGAAGGTVFAALTVSRVPLLFVAPLQALAVPAIVRWRHSGGGTARARRFLLLGVAATLVVGAALATGAWFLGPWAVRLAYGADYVIAPAAIAGLVFSACLLAGLQLMSAALIAFGSYRWVVVVWATGAVSTALWLLLSPLDLVPSAVVGAVVGPLTGALVAAVTLWRLSTGLVTAAPRPATGSV
ncbi:hypothetical protein [Cellulosimicrobium sp. Marseille-Q8652]